MLVTFADGKLMLDSVTLDVRNRALSGQLAYYFGSECASALESLVTGRDKAYRSSTKADTSYTFVSEDGGKFQILSASAWTSAETDREASNDLDYLKGAVKDEGWNWSLTVSSLAGRICREAVQTKQLPIRWRELAHNAIHQGPMVCARGGAAKCVAWDRERAFLRALYEPVPVGNWIAVQPKAFEATKGMHGLARATVRVDKSRYTERIPPLPVRMYGFTVYPTGEVRGTWTLALLWDALEHGGYEIVEVHEVAICQVAPIHSEAAQRIERVADSRLRKMLYTRYWGRLAATGGWEGYRDDRFPKPKRLLGSSLFWYYMGVSPQSPKAPPDYRPDHAAFISSANHLAMNRALRGYGPGQVIATHVDCIWVDNAPCPTGGNFREKHSGKARFYGVGCYNVGGNLAAQGYDGTLTTETIEQWGSKLHTGDTVYRKWHFTEPPYDDGATSDPPHHATAVVPREPMRNLQGDIYWEGWTSRGWVYKPKEEVSNGASSKEDAG